MNIYRQLAGQTAIYGLSSIIGRFLNYLLVPLYTRVFDQAEYGVVTQLYAYAAFLNIIFIYGLETAFFRFFRTEGENKNVYSTGIVSIVTTSLLFGLGMVLFAGPISSVVFTDQGGKEYFIKVFAGILVFDAIAAIPFAWLRQQNKAGRFAIVRLINIGLNIGLNLFFLVACPAMLKDNPDSFLAGIYDPTIGIGYVFISNLVASAVTLILLLPEILRASIRFDVQLWKKMIVYALPLMIAGFAGMINETLDRILIPYLISDESVAMEQLGIYGACYKLSIIMTLFIQTFRYAAEPFFFNNASKENPQRLYAGVMNLFLIVCFFIFLAVMLYIDWVKLFIGPDFRSGLGVVPILLLANLCLGVYYNLSIWYKLTDKTNWGAWMSVFGAAVTLSLNFILIPLMGTMGAAWATLICYAAMMVLSYMLGQKHYPVGYKVSSFFYYLLIVLLLWYGSGIIRDYLQPGRMMILVVNTLLLGVFAALVWFIERGKISYLRHSKSDGNES